MCNRRSFIRQTATILGSLALHSKVSAAFPLDKQQILDESGPEEDFWNQVRQAYACSPTILNLNNGGVCPAPRAAMDALDYYNRMCNEVPSYYMWRVLDQDRESLRQNLADLAGVSADEIAINRNATESLNTLIFGLQLEAGDEVILSKYDYPNMIHAWKQREMRDGIKLVWVDLDLPSEDADALTEPYISKITDKTRLIHLTHIINWSGQLMPVRKITDAAHARGVEVLVDGAQSFACLDHKIPDLGCDYWGTSLHKWLCAPYGNGMMWIKKEKISRVYALLSCADPATDDIRKFENLGTRSFPQEMATGYSLDLHHLIGSKRKQDRLQFLRKYWMDRVADAPGVYFNTPNNNDWAVVLGNFGIEGMEAGEISNVLFKNYKIHTTTINWESIHGVRVSPNVYTSIQEMDKFVAAVHEIAKR
jgi:selenocysteine lyase/cysteine desulfurase